MSVAASKALDRLLGGLALRLLRPVRALQDMARDSRETLVVREIAIVKLWGVGNAALLLPILGLLRERYPAARLTAVTMSGSVPLLEGAADRVIGVRMRPVAAAAADLGRAAARLRALRVDLGLDFEQYVRTSQVLLHVAGVRQIHAFDTRGLRRALLADVTVPYDDARHVAHAFLDLARSAGVRRREYVPGGLRAEAAAVARIDALLAARRASGRPLVVLHPGSGDNFPGRRWPTRRFGLLARRLAGEAVVALTGSRAEAGLCREVEEAAGGGLWNLCGVLDLLELVALLDRAALLVSNDTGPVHLASALGRPVLGLYGPNTPSLYGPLSPGSAAFYDAPPCSPCITNFNYKTSRCRNPVCIDAIGVDAVAEAALARLRVARREAGA